MNLLAHLTDIDGVRTEQSLKEHCFHTAEYAAQSVGNPGLYHTAYLAGLTHDMGKAKKAYEVYLEDAYSGKEVIRGSVNHTFAGVIYLLERYHTDKSVMLWVLIMGCLTARIWTGRTAFCTGCKRIERNWITRRQSVIIWNR